MNRLLFGMLAAACVALAVPQALAQESPNVLDRIFGGRSTPEPAANPQSDPAELTVRIDRLEAQIRQLTGTIEQLQFRNQQLEAHIRRIEGPNAPVPPTPPGPGRRSDVFDPNQNPNAPGAPKSLGTLPAGQHAELPPPEQPVGVPDGRMPGAPLDLSTLATAVPPSSQPPQQPGADLPPPPPRVLSATGAVSPASETAKGYFDLAYGYVLRKDYVFAEEAFKTFLSKYPKDALVPDAQFWLGESMFQRQRYDTAAEHFLAAATKHPGYAKAPDSLLRLAQSLAAINQKEMACATLAEVGRKYPRASNTVKQGVEREQKRVRC